MGSRSAFSGRSRRRHDADRSTMQSREIRRHPVSPDGGDRAVRSHLRPEQAGRDGRRIGDGRAFPRLRNAGARGDRGRAVSSGRGDSGSCLSECWRSDRASSLASWACCSSSRVSAIWRARLSCWFSPGSRTRWCRSPQFSTLASCRSSSGSSCGGSGSDRPSPRPWKPALRTKERRCNETLRSSRPCSSS